MEAVHSDKSVGFHPKKNGKNRRFETGYDLFKVVMFCIGRDGTDIYIKSLDQLALYAIT